MNLLMKVLFLTTLANGTRVSMMAALSRATIITDPRCHTSSCQGGLESLYPNQSISCSLPNISVKVLSNRASPYRLCPVVALLRYLSLTKDGDSFSVFPRPISRKPMKRESIRPLVVWTINLASPGIFATGHDVWQFSASLSWVRSFPPEDITPNMFKSSSSAFIRK